MQAPEMEKMNAEFPKKGKQGGSSGSAKNKKAAKKKDVYI
jgi:hypothetical protein